MDHYNRIPRRRAEFIIPPNTLKIKAGTGGLSDEILNTAQSVLEENRPDFSTLALPFIEELTQAIEKAKEDHNPEDTESILAMMLYPAMQLRANGGMFGYPLVSQIADRLIQLLEVIEEPDAEAIEIILAFCTALKGVIHGQITDGKNKIGAALLDALTQACVRYFDHKPQTEV